MTTKVTKLESVMVLPQKGPKIIASTVRIYAPGYAMRIGIDLIRLALPGVTVMNELRWHLQIVRQGKEIHLQYEPQPDSTDPTYVKSWRNGTNAKSILVNIGPALRALGIGAYDAIGTYRAQATKNKIVVYMNKKLK